MLGVVAGLDTAILRCCAHLEALEFSFAVAVTIHIGFEMEYSIP